MIIAVAGLNSGGEMSAGYGVLTALQSASGHDLIGLAYDPLDSSLYQKGLMSRAYQVPSPAEDWTGYLKRLSEIKMRHGLDLLIPGRHDDVPCLIEHGHDLEVLGVKTFLPSRRSLEDLSSQKFKNALKRRRISFQSPTTVGHVEGVVIRSLGKGPVQQAPAIELSSEDSLSMALLADRNHKMAALAVIKALQISPDGRIWMCLSIEASGFVALADLLIRETRWIGPMTVHLIRNGEGDLHIERIFPSFPDWIHFPAACGANLPAVMVDFLAGRPGPRPSFAAAGKLFVRAAVDMVTDIERLGIFSLEGETIYDAC